MWKVLKGFFFQKTLKNELKTFRSKWNLKFRFKIIGLWWIQLFWFNVWRWWTVGLFQAIGQCARMFDHLRIGWRPFVDRNCVQLNLAHLSHWCTVDILILTLLLMLMFCSVWQTTNDLFVKCYVVWGGGRCKSLITVDAVRMHWMITVFWQYNLSYSICN